MGRFSQLGPVVVVGLVEIADLPQFDPMIADLIEIRRKILDQIGLILLAVRPPIIASLAESQPTTARRAVPRAAGPTSA